MAAASRAASSAEIKPLMRRFDAISTAVTPALSASWMYACPRCNSNVTIGSLPPQRRHHQGRFPIAIDDVDERASVQQQPHQREGIRTVPRRGVMQRRPPLQVVVVHGRAAGDQRLRRGHVPPEHGVVESRPPGLVLRVHVLVVVVVFHALML